MNKFKYYKVRGKNAINSALSLIAEFNSNKKALAAYDQALKPEARTEDNSRFERSLQVRLQTSAQKQSTLKPDCFGTS